MDGVVHMTAGERQDCAIKQCPQTNCGEKCAAPARELNQAYDAVYVLARAIAFSSFQTGGKDYLAGAPGSREAAMVALRSTSLDKNVAASGALDLIPGGTTRHHWDFGYVQHVDYGSNVRFQRQDPKLTSSYNNVYCVCPVCCCVATPCIE